LPSLWERVSLSPEEFLEDDNVESFANGSVAHCYRKGVSFLSRLSMRGSKKKGTGDLDSDSELGSEARTDGTEARLFTRSMGAGGGYIPQHKEPPRYIRTKVHNKKIREFNRMFLAQELIGTRPPKVDGKDGKDADNGEEKEKTPAATPTTPHSTGGRRTPKTGGAIWAAEFSKDGKYLAAAGRDRVVRVWAVISTAEERRAHEEEEAAVGGTGERLNAPVFRGKPLREFEGHTGEVLDLSWSKNNFLLSSSMDKTVRLWHISRDVCLCTFKHKDFVTRLAFHPRDDRFFLAGSLDTMLRLWSIPDKAIAYSTQLPDLVTAVAFSPDGKTAIAGVLNGLCLFYDTDGLKFQTQIHVRSSRGKNAKGSKITGIQTMTVTPAGTSDSGQGGSTTSTLPRTPRTPRTPTSPVGAGEVKVLITSNDSRIRIYNLRDKTLDVKLKGHQNACSQIAARFSDDGKFIICGSEDSKAYIWNMGIDNSEAKDDRPCEYFDGHGDIVTNAIFAPTKSRMLLDASGDPLYDLCNPPPVTLMSLKEAASATASQVALSTEGEGANQAPEPTPPPNGHGQTKRPEESPAYIARSTHYDGNIIVTTDGTGIIKIFRQDCAFIKRKHESWETGSTFSRKMAGGSFVSGGLGRTGSMLTRTTASSAAHSRRGSLSQPAIPSSVTSPQLGAFNTSSDRIISWRQGIEEGSDKRTNSMTSGGTPTRSERSLSPSKARTPLSSSAATLASGARKQPYSGSTRQNGLASPTSSVFSGATAERSSIRDYAQHDADREREEATMPPAPSFSYRAVDTDDPLRLDPAGASYSFWNLNRWRNIGGLKSGAGGSGQGERNTTSSTGSPLSKTITASTKPDTASSDDTRKPGAEKQRRVSLNTNTNTAAAATTNRHPASVTSDASDDKSGRRRTLPPSSLSHEFVDGPQRATSRERLAPPSSRDMSLQSRGNSIVSKLSSELSSELEGELAAAGEAGADEETRCRKCGGREFKAKQTGGRQLLTCGRCGLAVA